LKLIVGIWCISDNIAVMNSLKNDNSHSLITRAGQIMAVIIGLGLVSMISSMLVAESLSGDAALINRAGQLRMLAVKVSRASILSDFDLYKETNHPQSTTKQQIKKRNNHYENGLKNFDQELHQLFVGGVANPLNNEKINHHYHELLSIWSKLKLSKKFNDIKVFDAFVVKLGQLVFLIQQESEDKISSLRAIYSVSLLLVIIVAFVVLTRINRSIIVPLKQLITVAESTAKGDFEKQLNYAEKNELGILSQTINYMSQELKLMHQNFEDRVNEKTSALSLNNQVLTFLYNISKTLTNDNFQILENNILAELQKILSTGEISLVLNEVKTESLAIDITDPVKFSEGICFSEYRFPLKKGAERFGYLNWLYPLNTPPKKWQSNLIEAVADMITTAHSLALKRVAENRLVIVEERAVIARELHDSLAQSLSYLKVQVALLTKKMEKQLPKEDIELTIVDIKQGLNRAYSHLRELLTTFRLKLDAPNLHNALRSSVVEFSTKCDHPIELQFNLPSQCLNANQEIHLLQIIREALSNIQRHAKANFAKVTVELKENKCWLTIKDNGQGMNDDILLDGHYGLGIIKERAISLNADIVMQSKPQQGTEIKVNFKV